MNIELRKIQKVGSSSLVVTLPKEWARRLGLKPGSRVVLVEEDDGIKIKPLEKGAGETIHLDLREMPDKLASAIPLCIYLSPVNEAEVLFPSRHSLEDARQRQFSLMGIYLVDMAGDTSARIEVLLDQSKIDIPKLLRTLASVIDRTVGLLLDQIKGEVPPEETGTRLRMLRRQFLATHYIVLRQLATRYSEKGGLENYQVTLSTSYAGFALDLLQDLSAIIAKMEHTNFGNHGEVIEEILHRIRESGELLFRLLATPSVSRLVELYNMMQKMKERVENAMLNVEEARSAIITMRLYDVVRLLMIAMYVAICRVILERRTGRSERVKR